MIDGGNTSKFDGDLTPLYKCANETFEEMEQANEDRRVEKEKEVELKQALEMNETTALERKDARKRKSVEGVVS